MGLLISNCVPGACVFCAHPNALLLDIDPTRKCEIGHGLCGFVICRLILLSRKLFQIDSNTVTEWKNDTDPISKNPKVRDVEGRENPAWIDPRTPEFLIPQKAQRPTPKTM